MEACLLTKAAPADKSGLVENSACLKALQLTLALTTESHPDRANTFFRMNINKI